MLSRKLRFIACLTAVCLCLAAGAFAQDNFGSLMQQGRQLFQAGKFQDAMTAFNRAFQLKPGDPAANFMLGWAAFELQDYETAVMAFDRVLILEPQYPRIKLELGRTYMRLGVRDLARQYFQEVLQEGPPPAVRRNVEMLLAEMDRAEQNHFWSGSLTLGLTRDDNVRVSPGSDQVNTALGVILLAPGARQERDFYHSTTLALNHLYNFTDSPWAWRSALVNYNAFYDTAGDLDITFLSFQSGPQYRKDRVSAGVEVLHSHLLKDYHTYLTSSGLAGNWMYALRPGLLLLASLRTEYKEYRQAPKREAWNINFGAGPVFTWGANTLITRAAVERENATDDEETYNRFAASLRYERQVGESWRGVGPYRYQQSQYEDPAALFNSRRRDKVHEFGCGLTYRISASTSAALSHTWSKSASTLGLYDYKRNVTALNFTVNF